MTDLELRLVLFHVGLFLIIILFVFVLSTICGE